MKHAAPLLFAGTLICAAFAPAALAQREKPEGQGGMSCVQGYAKAFYDLGNQATNLKLKSESAPAETRAIFKSRPARCEVGAYAYYLEQLVKFSKRALRSGATPATPKEGWIRAATVATGYAPERVPQAEYGDDLSRFRAARGEIAALVTEAGAGPLLGALLVSLDRASPVPGAYGPMRPPQATPFVAASPLPVYSTAPTAPAAVCPTPPRPVLYPVTLPPMTSPQQVNVPTVPLPDWGVVSLHQMSDLIKVGRGEAALDKLDPILRWVESQH